MFICSGATFFRGPFTPSAPCFGGHLPQRLFASKPFCPGANYRRCPLLASARFPQVPICIRLVLHLSHELISSDAHFYWCPLPLLPIPRCPFFSNAILVPHKNVVPMRSHRVLQTYYSMLSPIGSTRFYTVFSCTPFDLSPVCRHAQSSIVSLSTGHF